MQHCRLNGMIKEVILHEKLTKMRLFFPAEQSVSRMTIKQPYRPRCFFDVEINTVPGKECTSLLFPHLDVCDCMNFTH